MSAVKCIKSKHFNSVPDNQVMWPIGHLYGVALVRRIDKIIDLFCKRALQKRLYSARETYNLIDPTDRSHPIPVPLQCDGRLIIWGGYD